MPALIISTVAPVRASNPWPLPALATLAIAALILTTQTLIAKKPDDYDITQAPARGGGAELLGRA